MCALCVHVCVHVCVHAYVLQTDAHACARDGHGIQHKVGLRVRVHMHGTNHIAGV